MIELGLSAGCIIFDQDKVLLGLYKALNGSTCLMAPGSLVKPREDFKTALKRDFFEETGLYVRPAKMLFIEDMITDSHRLLKIWFLCSVVGGTLTKTAEAKRRGIVDLGWYNKLQLQNEIVYPKLLMSVAWPELLSDNFETRYQPLSNADF
jgi:ADP-ribose pyrophosphatase YjhB (NUDIX family)